MELSSLKIDSAKRDAGDWVRNIPGLGDVALKVRGFDNPDYRRSRSELIGALPPSLRQDIAATDKITVALIIETILLDWEGITESGAPIPYSRDKAAVILGDPDAKPLLDAVAWAAERVGATRAETIKADAGN